MSSTGEVESQAPAVEQLQVPAEETAVEQPETETAVEKPAKEKKAKAPKKKKPKTPSHPPYFQMIKEAITAQNEKGGTSPYAIAKYMEENHTAVLPANFRKILGLQLKNSVAKGKLIKIKASYKLSEAGKREKSVTATTTKAARANAAKPKDGGKKRRPKSKSVSKIENPHATSVAAAAAVATTRARRSKRSAPAAKPKQLKSIKSPFVKKARKGTA